MLVKLGNRLFHMRNYLFPVFYAALFIPSANLFPGNQAPLLIGLSMIATGMLIRSITIGLVYIIRGGKNRTIHANELVTVGIYSVCRNPMYLGNLLLLFGFGMFANSLLFLGVFFPLFCLFYLAIIRAEEDFLTGRFGEVYLAYKYNTHAVMPDLRKIKGAFAGTRFNVLKVIRKEYNSWFLYVAGILGILTYRYSSLHYAGIAMAIGTALYFSVKFMKSRGYLG